MLSDLGEKSTPTMRAKLARSSDSVVEVARDMGLAKVAKDPAKLLEATNTAKRTLLDRLAWKCVEVDTGEERHFYPEHEGQLLKRVKS